MKPLLLFLFLVSFIQAPKATDTQRNSEVPAQLQASHRLNSSPQFHQKPGELPAAFTEQTDSTHVARKRRKKEKEQEKTAKNKKPKKARKVKISPRAF